MTVDTSGKFNNKKIKIWLKWMKFGHFLGCHQIAERSFFIKGYQFPICARCSGVALGEIIALTCIWFLKIPLWVSLILLIPMLIDWSLQFFKILKSSNIRRFLTGILCGFGLTFIYYKIIVFIIHLLF